jgi:hypothetical protein
MEITAKGLDSKLLELGQSQQVHKGYIKLHSIHWRVRHILLYAVGGIIFIIGSCFYVPKSKDYTGVYTYVYIFVCVCMYRFLCRDVVLQNDYLMRNQKVCVCTGILRGIYVYITYIHVHIHIPYIQTYIHKRTHIQSHPITPTHNRLTPTHA